jgi:hypothetical protein
MPFCHGSVGIEHLHFERAEVDGFLLEPCGQHGRNKTSTMHDFFRSGVRTLRSFTNRIQLVLAPGGWSIRRGALGFRMYAVMPPNPLDRVPRACGNPE